MKDNFSRQSKLYAQFRPSYPKELFDFLLQLAPERKTAWDCGTGNGQVAVELAKHFKTVFATDISENQIKNAPVRSNITYKIERAEKTTFSDNQFDLVTIAQAIHWFNFQEFYAEVNRTLKPDGIIAIIGYPLMKIDVAMDKAIEHFYNHIVGKYWDKERRYLDELYQTIPFPFKEISHPTFQATYEWNFDQLVGYLNTWSAVQHYITQNGENPVEQYKTELSKSWGSTTIKNITFPILLRAGKK